MGMNRGARRVPGSPRCYSGKQCRLVGSTMPMLVTMISAVAVVAIPATLTVASRIPLVVWHHDQSRRRARVARLVGRRDDDRVLPTVLVLPQAARLERNDERIVAVPVDPRDAARLDLPVLVDDAVAHHGGDAARGVGDVTCD